MASCICPKCGYPNECEEFYCAQCEFPLRVAKTPRLCPTCQRMNPTRRKTCLTCGRDLVDAPIVKLGAD